MFTFKSTTNLSSLTSTALPLCSQLWGSAAGRLSRPAGDSLVGSGSQAGNRTGAHKPLTLGPLSHCHDVGDWLGTEQRERNYRKWCETISDDSSSIRNINAPIYPMSRGSKLGFGLSSPMVGKEKLPLLSVYNGPLWFMRQSSFFLPQLLTSKGGGNGTFLALILNACSQ